MKNSMDIFDEYEVKGCYFDDDGVLHIRLAGKGTNPPDDAYTVKNNFRFDDSGNLKAVR